MTNSNHSHHLTQTKEFDFVFVGEETLRRFSATYQSAPSAMKVSAFDQKTLQRFHEEFKCLVIAANQAYLEHEAIAWADTSLHRPIEPHEIEWMEWINTSEMVLNNPLRGGN